MDKDSKKDSQDKHGEDGDKTQQEGDSQEQGSEGKSHQESLDSIWNSYADKVKEGKSAAAATLCDCEDSGAVCCAGAREYNSK